MLPDALPPAVTPGAHLHLVLLAPPLLSDRGVLKPLSPRGDGSRSSLPSALPCLSTTHGDAPCARHLCSCALSVPSPCALSQLAVAAFPTPPSCPHIGRRSSPHPPSYFYLPHRGGRPARRGTRLRPCDTRAPRRALDSDRHPAPPPPDATLPSPPLRGRLIAALSRPFRLRRPPPRVPPSPTAGAGDSAGGGRGEGRAWHHRSTRRRRLTKMLKSGPSWQRGWQSTSATPM